jgi:uncharacterized Zn finger protein (UPF0148 family)
VSALDLGAPVAHEGRCDVCGLTERPLWAHDGRVRCASCWTREYPGRALTFHGAAVETVAQLTLFLGERA